MRLIKWSRILMKADRQFVRRAKSPHMDGVLCSVSLFMSCSFGFSLHEMVLEMVLEMDLEMADVYVDNLATIQYIHLILVEDLVDPVVRVAMADDQVVVVDSAVAEPAVDGRRNRRKYL